MKLGVEQIVRDDRHSRLRRVQAHSTDLHDIKTPARKTLQNCTCRKVVCHGTIKGILLWLFTVPTLSIGWTEYKRPPYRPERGTSEHEAHNACDFLVRFTTLIHHGHRAIRPSLRTCSWCQSIIIASADDLLAAWLDQDGLNGGQHPAQWYGHGKRLGSLTCSNCAV